jgi:hypothetical protein
MPYVSAPFKMNVVQTEKLNALRTGTLKVETFTEPKALLENPHFQEQRHRCLAGLSDGMIDKPIIELIHALNELPYCFTLQSCFGHFVCFGQNEPHNLKPLPIDDSIAKVEYRIAYIAFCIEHSALGRMLLDALKEITDVDPENIQFCCAEWFWERQVNSYALQVEPDRFKSEDKVMLEYKEALRIEKIRNQFFIRLYNLIENLLKK